MHKNSIILTYFWKYLRKYNHIKVSIFETIYIPRINTYTFKKYDLKFDGKNFITSLFQRVKFLTYDLDDNSPKVKNHVYACVSNKNPAYVIFDTKGGTRNGFMWCMFPQTKRSLRITQSNRFSIWHSVGISDSWASLWSFINEAPRYGYSLLLVYEKSRRHVNVFEIRSRYLLPPMKRSKWTD